jgi:predicted SnoaL-like aldol condensation-catalyzing enzyme
MERTNGRRKTHRPSRFDRRLHRPGPERGRSYFAPDYIQHNPVIPSGRTAIPGLIAGLSKEFSYEPGMVVAEGNLVMVHGRYVGWGPKPMIAVDIFRVVNGKLVEHWDVMQEEVPASKTASGNPMFSPLRGGT